MAEQRCPHCLRAFKRLRAHLPHCKAAPGTAANPEPTPQPGPRTGTAGSGSGTGRALPAGKARGAAAPEGSEEPGSGKKAEGERGGGKRRQPGGDRAEAAVRAVARCLDLPPEEVTGIPEQLGAGVQIVIKNHRARVLREQSGSRGKGSATGRQRQSSHGSSGAGPDPRGTEPARAEPREGTLGPQTAKREPRGSGAAAAGSKGGKGRGKAPEASPLGAPGRSSPRDPPPREGGDRAGAEEQLLGIGVGYDPSLPAPHPPKLLPAAEGAPESDPKGPQTLPGGGKEAAATAQPIPEGRRDTELALPQSLLQHSQSQASQPAPAQGLEWFPDLYPNYRGLSLFPGKPFHEDIRSTVKALTGDCCGGQPGVPSAQPLLDVRLGQLPAWLATRDLSAQGLLGGAQRAWSSFSSRYLKVKRGSPAGISMLLAGSCLLTYCWDYQHLKHHRWRRHH